MSRQSSPVFKNSISLKRLVEDCLVFGVIGCADESDFGPIFVCCDLDGWLDESASAASHRIFDRGESSSSRTDWQSPFEIQRQSAPAVGCKGEKAWSEAVGTGGDHRDSRNTDGLAPETDCAEVRWHFVSNTWTTGNGQGNRGAGCADGRREWSLGISTDTGSTCQSGSRTGTQHDCEHPETTWHRAGS